MLATSSRAIARCGGISWAAQHNADAAIAAANARLVVRPMLSNLRQQPLDRLLRLPHIAAGEEIGVVEDVVEVVEVAAHAVAVGERPGFAVCGGEVAREAAEEL